VLKTAPAISILLIDGNVVPVVVKIEVYSLLGQILENENLSRGIYIVKASLKNGRSIVVKRYI